MVAVIIDTNCPASNTEIVALDCLMKLTGSPGPQENDLMLVYLGRTPPEVLSILIDRKRAS